MDNRHPIAPTVDVLRLYDDEYLSSTEIAEHFGVSRQRVSQVLLENGRSPAARLLAKREANRRAYLERKGVKALNRHQKRLQKATRRARIEELADSLGVAPYTLASFADRTGPYRVPTTRSQMRRNMRLPNRYTPEGELLARQVKDIAAPWSPRHLMQNREKADW